ncbi:peptidylprolyl isomerase [Haoranjiania flava]|uniref:peptidylprolyl isomerase n=1 Tax=Haoranjiania flava TaxID=1856322 RepID=A0AAE3IPV8_9BACT|nr:peptidylprolyl isomerase [Haoranjiania flava]MCU7693617.1 peptidylprolyl isomerase [Haoranjiania flava]
MKKSILLSILLGAYFCSYAQNNLKSQPRVLIDGIAAIVGDGIVLKSEVDIYMEQHKHETGQTFLPPNTKCLILASFIQNKVLAIQAQKDSLPVTDEQIEQELDGRINLFIRQYGSREEVEKIVNKPLYQYKEDLRAQVKEQALAQAAQQNIIKHVRITPTEVEAYYNSIPVDSLRYKESQYEVSQLVMDPQPAKSAEDALIEQMTKWKNDIENGRANFTDLARQHSDEPSAKQTGGQLSVNKDAGGFDPVFMTAAFKLKEGQISPVVKTAFGYHIIQMVSKVGSDAVVRHIIKLPPLGDTEVREAIERADSLRTIIINNNIPFNTAVNRFSDDENLKYTGGAVISQNPNGGYESVLTLDQFTDKQIADAVAKMKVGEISEAQIFQNPMNGKLQVRLLYLRSKTEPHRENLKDDFNEISHRALSIKQQNVLGNWLTKNVGNYYIKVSEEYNDCPNVLEWTKLSEQNLNHFSTR